VAPSVSPAYRGRVGPETTRSSEGWRWATSFFRSGDSMERRPHRSAMSIAIGRMLAELGTDTCKPVQLDLFASPADTPLFKRRRGRPPSARAKRKGRRR